MQCGVCVSSAGLFAGTLRDISKMCLFPVMSAHINFLGQYEFDVTTSSVQTNISALLLRSMNEIIEQLI